MLLPFFTFLVLNALIGNCSADIVLNPVEKGSRPKDKQANNPQTTSDSVAFLAV